MSARKGKRDVQDGMRQLGQIFDKAMDKHLGELKGDKFSCFFSHLLLPADPSNQPARSKISLLVGLIPHIVIFIFAATVVWLAKPSSSELH